MINWGSWLLWGFASTVILTSIMAGSHGLGLTRMNIPYLVGTMFTPNRDRAKSLGVLVHVINGWIFSFIYVAAFHLSGGPTWWKGAAIGLVHATFILAAAMPVLPGMHPRMASESRGPTVVRQLEPPGFFALHYGIQTPIWSVIAHVVFGIVLGVFYRPA
jgi:uncharacterized membrane protein YagU involved in acid resistance